jgi:hypothetical protein
LLEGQKPSKRVVLWGNNGLYKCNKTFSQYSTYGFIFISYAGLCAMLTFQKSTYLDSPELINFSLSTNLDASLPQTGRYKTWLRTLISNFGEPYGLAFHNLIEGPSIGLHTRSARETLYYIIGQPTESTKKLNKCISICPTIILRTTFKQPRT